MPPVVEVFCEVRFQQSKYLPFDKLSTLHSKIKSSFSEVSETLRSEEQISYLRGTVKDSKLIKFFDKDRNYMFQVSDDLFSFHQFKPYKKWEDFKNILISNFKIYKDVIQPSNIKYLLITYKNLINLPRAENLLLENYFNVFPSVPDNFPNMNEFSCKINLPYGNKEIAILDLKSIPVNLQTEYISFELNLNYFIAVPSNDILSENNMLLKQAQLRIEELFEGAITDNCKNLFGRNKNV